MSGKVERGLAQQFEKIHFDAKTGLMFYPNKAAELFVSWARENFKQFCVETSIAEDINIHDLLVTLKFEYRNKNRNESTKEETRTLGQLHKNRPDLLEDDKETKS